MELGLVERGGKRFLAGPEGKPLLRDVADTVRLIEACANHETDRILLYAENLTEHFFDLSSRQAGEILQKLRNYYVRMAVVWSPATTRLSRRFGELMAQENRDRYFRLFEERSEAEAWLLEG
jgi:hypothetical protein